MILNDKQIYELYVQHAMIIPFQNASCKVNEVSQAIYTDAETDRTAFKKIPAISYGLSSFGYDIRLGGKFRIFSNAKCPPYIDAKNFNSEIAFEENREYCVEDLGRPVLIPGNGFVLAESFETFNMPEDVFAICVGKSTYARVGLIVNVTPLEPGWEGRLTIELSNTTNMPLAVYPFEGIAQLIFFKGARPEVTYADRKGKYQNQTGLTYSRV